MIQTINPSFNDKSKTAEIMARYRPIAPKPDCPPADADSADATAGSSSSLPLGIRKSPFLVSVWNQLQARPTRTRKRGRTALGPLVSVYKRSRFASNAQTHYYTAPMAAHSGNLSFVPTAVGNGYPSVRHVPNLHPMKIHPRPVPAHSNAVSVPAVPMEVDFIHQLEKPNNNNNKVAVPVPVTVISPRAIRPVGSIITVGMISPAKKGPGKRPLVTFCKRVLLKKADVERDVELEALPAVVSDSEHRVRLTNAAYNEMVGQPECPWLDFGVGRPAGGACRRIGGEVVLKLANEAKVGAAEGFSCYVRIEWGKKDGGGGEIKHVVNAYCEAVRLACDSDDYFLQWRFHVKEASESGSNA